MGIQSSAFKASIDMISNLPFIHEFGVPDGRPVVFFHGFPGSHRQAFVLKPWAAKFNLRVLSVDRPGYGFSDPRSGPDLKTFLPKLETALEKLKVGRFYLVGVSGGNPAAVSAAGYFAAYFARLLLEKKFPDEVDLLKVEVPSHATPETEWQTARLSRRRYYESVPAKRNSWEEPGLITYKESASLEHEDEDTYAC